MTVIKPYTEIMTPINGEEILRHIELCGRICYKSEDKITPDSSLRFVGGLIKRGHESVLEHFSFSVRFVCDRGVTHEIVRHRIASYSQESTRYCNYEKADSITFIKPFFLEGEAYADWEKAMQNAEDSYMKLIREGAKPEQARSVLPNSLKTEIVMTANLREWRHFLKLRSASGAHPQIREVAIPLLNELKEKIPVVFDDITATM